MNAKSDITQLLQNISEGDKKSYNKLFSIIYDELKNIANNQLNIQFSDHTLSKTDLVHEAYLKLIDQDQINANDRTHFYAIAARTMRHLLVDYARKKKAQKRGGKQHPISLNEDIIHIKEHADQIIGMDDCLNLLMELDERIGKIVELRFYAGFSIEETASMLKLSTSTVNRDWAKARGWLYQCLKNESPDKSL